MSGSKHCPVCDRPPGDPDRNDRGATCGMWWTLQGRRCMPSYEELLGCYNRAKPMRDTIELQRLELVEVRQRLKQAQAALSRRHAAAQPIVERDIKPADMFPDNARIE